MSNGISHDRNCRWWHRMKCNCGAAENAEPLTDAQLAGLIREWHRATPMGDQVAALVLLATIEDTLLKRTA